MWRNAYLMMVAGNGDTFGARYFFWGNHNWICLCRPPFVGRGGSVFVSVCEVGRQQVETEGLIYKFKFRNQMGKVRLLRYCAY